MRWGEGDTLGGEVEVLGWRWMDGCVGGERKVAAMAESCDSPFTCTMAWIMSLESLLTSWNPGFLQARDLAGSGLLSILKLRFEK